LKDRGLGEGKLLLRSSLPPRNKNIYYNTRVEFTVKLFYERDRY